MSSVKPSNPKVMTTADGTPLKRSLERSIRWQRLWAFLLVAPLLLFIVASFIIPVFQMAMHGVQNPEVATYMPRTVKALNSWNGEGIPDEATFAALVIDLSEGRKNRVIGKVATRLNYERAGMRRLIMGSARRAVKFKDGPYQAAMIKIDKEWGKQTTWALIKRE